jgi:superfamily I DNA/RNA helicase
MIELNQKQREAVESGDGPVLIVAGPGTGKTKTLTARIAHLVGQGVKVDRILALTFTVKAAREMHGRVNALLDGKTATHISTIHALGYQVLREAEPDRELAFIGEAERLALLRSLARPKELSGLSARELSLAVSNAKSSTGEIPPTLGSFVRQYQDALRAKDLVDFDDLLYRAHKLLTQDEALRQSWQQRFSHVLIDEFQDTSELQWLLIKLIAGTDNLFVIGDPKQSIYGFRGASADMFAIFRRDFPSCREVALDVNYRSATSIVALASTVFPGEDALTAHSTEAGVVRAIRTLNEYSEAELVLSVIEQGIGGSDMLKASVESGGRGFGDFAILYRTHRASKAVQRRLHDSGIPFQVVGEGSPYEQPDVQAVIQTLGWFARGESVPVVKGLSETQVRALLETIDAAQPASKLAQAAIEAFGLASDVQKQQRLRQFVGTLVRFDAPGLEAVARHFELIAQDDFYDPEADAVTLLTIHASKGLEFSHVILIATEEDILPHIRKTAETDFDEEKRLFYVAVTRAKDQLDIMYAKKRGSELREASRFVRQLGENVLPRIDDPNTAQLEKKLRRREQKARQGTLF